MNEIQRIASEHSRRLAQLLGTAALENLRQQEAEIKRILDGFRGSALAAFQAQIPDVRALIEQSAVEFATQQIRTTLEIVGPRLFEMLPDINAIKAWGDDLNAIEQALQTAGFSGLVDSLPASWFDALAGVDRRVQPAWVTNRLLHISRSQEFSSELESAFGGSVVLKDRWPAVEEALAVHRDRRYLLSIPALLAATEGVIGDALILKGVVRPIGGKLYLKDSSGRRVKNKTGKYVTISGAQNLATHSKKIGHETLDGVADYLTTQFVGSRNPILHGRKVRYASPKLSVQCLFALYMLAGAISEFERGN